MATGQPIMPLSLFRVPTFSIVVVIGLFTGFAMFGALAYLPTFMQMLKGVSATESGLRLVTKWSRFPFEIAQTDLGEVRPAVLRAAARGWRYQFRRRVSRSTSVAHRSEQPQAESGAGRRRAYRSMSRLSGVLRDDPLNLCWPWVRTPEGEFAVLRRCASGMVTVSV